jgi:hypothetical protein
VNVIQLRNTINALLSLTPNLLGSYVLPNGTKIPAVYVVGQSSVPKEWKVEGLEAAIRQFPNMDPSAGVGIANVLKQWEVVLIQYRPDGAEMQQAMDRMVRRFPDCSVRFVQGTDISYERCRFIIPDREIRNLIVV